MTECCYRPSSPVHRNNKFIIASLTHAPHFMQLREGIISSEPFSVLFGVLLIC